MPVYLYSLLAQGMWYSLHFFLLSLSISVNKIRNLILNFDLFLFYENFI